MLREKAWRKKALWDKGGTEIQGKSYRQQFVSPIKHTTREGNLWFPEVPFHQKPKDETVSYGFGYLKYHNHVTVQHYGNQKAQ